MKLSDQITRRQLFVAFGMAQQSGGLSSVDLATTRDANRVIVTASDGSAAPVEAADQSAAGVMSAADKTKLDDLAPGITREIATRADIPATSVGAAVTRLRTAGHANEGDGGHASYARVGAEPAHAWKVQSADGAWWELIPDHGAVDVRQLGAVGDGVADDWQAFHDAVNNGPALDTDSDDAAGYDVLVPGTAGGYFLGATLEFNRIVRLIGSGSGIDNTPRATLLSWPANTTGIIVHDRDTTGATTGTAGAGKGSVIRGLRLESAGGSIANITDDTRGHGIWPRGTVVIEDVWINQFPGNGLYVHARTGSDPATKGNANRCRVIGLRSTNNHLDGIHVEGDDANASFFAAIDCTHNGRWGIDEGSMLGNEYRGLHISNNGKPDNGENGGTKSSIVNFGGVHYVPVVGASEADLVNTEPGTNENVWRTTSHSGGLTWASGQPEGTYFHGGAIKAVNANARCIFSGYLEPGQGPTQINLPSRWDGGHHTMTKMGSGIYLSTSGSYAEWSGKTRLNHQDTHPVDTAARRLEAILHDQPWNVLSLIAEGDDAKGLNIGRWNDTRKWWAIAHNDDDWRQPVVFTSTMTDRKWGRSSTGDVGPGQVGFLRGLWLGGGLSGADARHMQVGDAAPTSGNWARGDIVWNSDPASGGVAGWVCVSGGTPGTWAEIRGLGAQTSGASQAALTNSTAGTPDGTLAAVGDTTASDQSGVLNDNFTELHTLLDEVRTTLVNFGLMKGAA